MNHKESTEIGSAALGFIDRGLCALCAAIIAAFSVMLIAQVFLRQVGEPLFWIEELCQYLMVYLCFLGSALAWGRREHLVVDFLPSLLGEKQKKVLAFLVDGTVLAFAVWATYASAEFAIFSMRKTSISLDLPVGYGYLGAPIGFAIMGFQSLVYLMGCHQKQSFAALELEEVGM